MGQHHQAVLPLTNLNKIITTISQVYDSTAPNQPISESKKKKQRKIGNTQALLQVGLAGLDGGGKDAREVVKISGHDMGRPNLPRALPAGYRLGAAAIMWSGSGELDVIL